MTTPGCKPPSRISSTRGTPRCRPSRSWPRSPTGRLTRTAGIGAGIEPRHWESRRGSTTRTPNRTLPVYAVTIARRTYAHQMADEWILGDAYEAYVGRWSRRVAAQFVRWLAIPPGRRWL